MADYRLHAQIISRSDGKSAVAAAAYRASERILDERTGELKDFTRKRGVLYTEILTPGNAPEWMRERARLWNGVEHREDKSTRRSSAQLARELQLSLPHELTLEQNLYLVRDFIKKEFVEHGIVADIAIHAPSRHGDGRNYHAHVLLTLREIRPEGFGKKARLWERQELNTKRKSWDQFETERLVEWRRLWAVYENRALVRYGHEQRVDHRSLEDQGIDREPTTHIGPDANEMERRGIDTDRGDQNRRIKAANDDLALLKSKLTESEKRLAELKQQLADERAEQIQKTVWAADAVWQKAEARWPPTPEPEPPAPARQVQPQGPPSHPPDSAPVSPGGKAASMPDNVSELSEQQKRAGEQEAARQKQEQDAEQARQKQAADDQEKTTEALKQQEKQSQEQKQEQDRVQQLRDAENKQVEDSAKQNAERIAAQAEQMRLAQQRLDAEQANIAAFYAEQNRLAQEDKRRQDAERQAKLEEQAKEGPIRNASYRYGQALGQNYDIRDPYASLAKSAMAEYAAFSRDREAYDRQIAKTADPLERQALDLRKRIEGADYLALTGDRVAVMSEIITGRRNSQEAVKERQKATDWRIKAQDLRQQLRDLQRERAPDKDRQREPTPDKDPERTPAQVRPAEASRPPSRPASRSTQDDDLIKKQDELQKEKDRQERENDPERQMQQERERELQRKRDRER
jgi:hypothetical protein